MPFYLVKKCMHFSMFELEIMKQYYFEPKICQMRVSKNVRLTTGECRDNPQARGVGFFSTYYFFVG